MRLLRLVLPALGTVGLLVAGNASLTASPAVTDDLLAPLASAYIRAVKPGEQAEFYRALFRTVLREVLASYPREVDATQFTAVAMKVIEPLGPQSGDPADVFKKSMNAALAWLDPHSYYMDAREYGSELRAINGTFGRPENVRTQTLHWTVESDVLVLRLESFMELASADMEQAIAEATAVRHPRGVVLDLRGNRGGVFCQGVNTADAFLREGEIVSMRGRNGVNWRTWRADPVEKLAGVPMVVLIDGKSASVSELVAAALQENGRATVMGQRSFGKGSIQLFESLGADKGALYLTIALFYGPSGRSVQRTGVTPDIELVPTLGNAARDWQREDERPNALPGTHEPIPPKARVDELRCTAVRAHTDPALACALAYLGAGDINRFLTALEAARPDQR